MKIVIKRMGSSSDESFAWTNASNSSNSSIDNTKIIQHNMTGNGLDDDSDYGTNYKKKLHQKLFLKNEGTDDSDYESHQKTKEKAKCKRKNDDILESPRKNKIKLEPESDKDTSKKKKNKRKLDSHDNMSDEDTSQNYSNLNITVKEEQKLGSHKQRKTAQSISLNHELEYNMKNNIKKDRNNSEIDEKSCNASIDDSYIKKKKKKSRKRQDSLIHDDDADNTSTDGKNREDTTSYIEHTEEHKKVSVNNEKSKHKQEVKTEHYSNKSELSDNDNGDQSRKSNCNYKSHKNSNNTSEIEEKRNKRLSRISDRIHFEDADSTQMDTTINNQAENINSRKLKKFLKINNNLIQIPIPDHSHWTLNTNYEIWAIRSPQNIDVNSFLGTNIKLDRKTKIKVNNQTYVGSMNNESASITVLSSEGNNYVIKKLPLSGTLHLHRKIPKVHVPDDNVILDNQTDFVPLPDTKNRHPLFGSNYKKAIKLPSAIAQRLNQPYSICDTSTVKTKKKKHKHDKHKRMDVDKEELEEIHDPGPEDDNKTAAIIKKKNRKRKHETDTEHSSAKRVKHAADSAEVWESEQAIEENLFNF